LGSRVRITGLFGQLWSVLGESSPNHRLIRTAFVYSWGIESESQAYSDSFCLFLANRVRITGLFGQVGAILGESSPNHRHIRTAFGHSWGIESEYNAMSEMSHPGVGAYKLSKLAVNALTQMVAAAKLMYGVELNR
jgi:hypothetical protein